MTARVRAWVQAERWTLGFLGGALLIVVLHLSALQTSPPGLYIDEASVGYNAWAVAHTGHDEHGHLLPFYFEAFGEYKNPVYIYALAPLTRFMPLTPYTVRLPAALFGLLACLALALFAYAVTRSRGVALLAGLTAGITPWLTQESRLGFEVISMVALLAVMLWWLGRAVATDSARWYGAAGAALGLSTFAYSTARVFTVMLVLALGVCFGIGSRSRTWLAAAIGPVLALLTLGIYIAMHQGAITARYNAIGITFDHPGLFRLVQRFFSNYADYWDPRFLFTHGDGNLRHNTGWGGMLLVTTIPLLILGAATCLRRLRTEPMPRFVLLGAVMGPVPAALTAEGTPHSLRAACMLPFLLALMAYGWAAAADLLRDRRALAAVLAVAVCAEAGSYFYDMFVEYPGRALAWFDTGQGPAIERAVQLAAGAHQVFVSSNLEAGYIETLFYLRPDPPPEGESAEQLLAGMGIHFEDPGVIARDVHAGDYMVVAPADQLPSSAQVVEVDRATVGGGAASVVGSSVQTVDLVVIARD